MTSSADLARLARWQRAGGTWQVVRRSSDDLVIALCRCDGGEEADRFTSREPDLIAHVGPRSSSEEPGPGS